jgi:hypothetical protein
MATPIRCPGRCGAFQEDLYIGFNRIECPNRGCDYHSEKQESIVKERYALIKKQREEAFRQKQIEQEKDIYNLIDENFDEEYSISSQYNVHFINDEEEEQNEKEDITKKIKLDSKVITPFYVFDLFKDRDDS